ncbi:MAG: fused MFS/spermidine synthase [Methylococcales bacterium]|jgi:hypothetical protein|nr:fused MFS/spermidine synthase [Methylococcales bacterium]MBT4599311.1 fused MFS/spermidine synthase [Methylococcales bacterium]MBT7575501.1 fused MFS/spermidine synthase [Methylococcales bacterium]
MKNSLIHYGIVFTGGASILAIEILGSRIMGPYFGVNLFLWTALLSMTLIALALGYFWGGILADYKPSYKILATLIFIAALWLFILPHLTEPISTFSRNFGYKLSILFTSLCLFTIPLGCLGCVTPYVLKLRANSLNKVATDAGDLYAFSTIASVLAALATGYFFIPFVGVKEFTNLIALALTLLAVLLYFYGRKQTN